MARKLRIAVSVFFGLLTVALCVLWVRSYWSFDCAGWVHSSHHGANAQSCYGVITLGILWPRTGELLGYPQPGWWTGSQPTNQAGRDLNEIPKFYYSCDDDEYRGIGFPFWLAILFCFALAIPFPLRRAFRFSLRTLLIATTLVAAVLGLAVWAGR